MNTLRQIQGIDEVLVKHPNGETRWLPIESVTLAVLTVRWGLNGLYEISTFTGQMRAKSVKARLRAHCPWVAADTVQIAAFAREKLGLN